MKLFVFKMEEKSAGFKAKANGRDSAEEGRVNAQGRTNCSLIPKEDWKQVTSKTVFRVCTGRK